ncbi:hypothetical protein HYFRA_00010099, partial [Hymenoscyphus fraxineus]
KVSDGKTIKTPVTKMAEKQLLTTTNPPSTSAIQPPTPSLPNDIPKKPLSFHISLLTLTLLALIVSWDTTALSVAIPLITSQLHASTLQAFLANIAFTLAVAISQPLYLSVSDAVGRKIPLYVSMLLFTIGSIMFALARSIGVVIAGRLVQGFGGYVRGGLDILQEIIIVDMTSLKERPKYLALMALPIALGSIMGPIIGALLCQFVTWRWLGWINLPFVGPAIPLAVLFMRLQPLEQDLKTKLRRVDWGGMFLFTIGTTCIALPVSWADALYPWSSWRTYVPLIVGIISFIIFGFYEAHPVQPMLPYRLFKSRTAVVSIIGGGIHGLLLFSILLYLPLFFQVRLESLSSPSSLCCQTTTTSTLKSNPQLKPKTPQAVYLQTPLSSALSILPACVISVLSSVLAPLLVSHTRHYTLLLRTGWALLTLSTGLLYTITQTTSQAQKTTILLLLGIGLGIVFQTIPFPLQASVSDADDSGRLVGLLVITRFLGGLLGLAIGSVVFNSGFARQIAIFGELPVEVGGLSDSSQAIGFIPMLRTVGVDAEVMRRLLEAYRIPFRSLWVVLAAISGVGFVMSLFTEELDLEREELGRQRFSEA